MSVLASFTRWRRGLKAAAWRRAGHVPGGAGHGAARWLAIESAVGGATAGRYGWDDAGIDERVVEYAWSFERMKALSGPGQRVLDAGSVLNYPPVLTAWRAARLPQVSIVTLKYEGFADPSDDVRYEFADLRQLPYRDEWFSSVLSLSTLEHVGLDNTIYGAAGSAARDPNAEVVAAMRELHRVTKRGGTLLVSVPFGARSHRGWFRIFDDDDLQCFTQFAGWTREVVRYFRQKQEGWREVDASAARDAGYNEPAHRPGQRTAPAWVSGAESVALLELRRS